MTFYKNYVIIYIADRVAPDKSNALSISAKIFYKGNLHLERQGVIFMSKFDITGQKFGFLTVLGRDTSTIGERNSKWICECECGSVKTYVRCALVSGHTKSCGCKNFGNATKHGMSKTRIFSTWCKMRSRCRNASPKDYKSYQAKGISVCKEWDNDFMCFYQWAMNNGYSEELTIDRIDNPSH